MLTLPNRMHPGDTFGLIAPASPPPDPKTVDHAVAALEKMGFAVKLGRNVRNRWGFLAGQDRERADDVMRMFTDKKVHGIICLRGGYGAGRVLPLLDYSTITKNPKVFVGYSDITSLHCALLRKSRLLTFHGPTVAAAFTEPDYPIFSRQSWLRILTQPEAAGSLCAGYEKKNVETVTRGKIAGELIGGNLSVLMTTLATPYQPSLRGKILFIEDVGEKPYQMDRMLTHLSNAGLLQQVVGVAVGTCDDCGDPRAKAGGEFRQTVEDVFRERLRPLKIPVVIGLPFGHVPHNATIPCGGRALLDATGGDLIITHPAVR
jgi:muramoyltetrapeptide carboxypeptidase